MIGFAIATLIIGGGLAFLASEYPDGLEWSIEKITGATEIESVNTDSIATSVEKVQSVTSILPDYDNSLSGIIGALMVVILLWSITSMLTKSRRSKKQLQ